MPTFAYIVERIGSAGTAGMDSSGLNEALRKLQSKGAKILDVKLNICSTASMTDMDRIYLILYEAESQVL